MFCRRFYDLDSKVKVIKRSSVVQINIFHNLAPFTDVLAKRNLAYVYTFQLCMFCTRFYDLDFQVKVTGRSNVVQINIPHNLAPFMDFLSKQNSAYVCIFQRRNFYTKYYDLDLQVKVTEDQMQYKSTFGITQPHLQIL